MKYEEIYSRSYIKNYDPSFFKDKKFAYDTMKLYLHEIASESYVKKIFNTLKLDDELEELTYDLKETIDKEYDEDFVKKLFSDGFIICWMRPKVDSIINVSTAFGGKEEKRLISNYEANKDRLTQLENKHKKYVRSHGYDKLTLEME